MRVRTYLTGRISFAVSVFYAIYKMPFLIIRSLSLRPWLLTMNSSSLWGKWSETIAVGIFLSIPLSVKQDTPSWSKRIDRTVNKKDKKACCMCLWERVREVTRFWGNPLAMSFWKFSLLSNLFIFNTLESQGITRVQYKGDINESKASVCIIPDRGLPNIGMPASVGCDAQNKARFSRFDPISLAAKSLSVP